MILTSEKVRRVGGMCETKGSQWFLKGSQQKLEHGLESMTPIDYNKGQIFYNRNSLLCVIEGHNTGLLKVFCQ